MKIADVTQIRASNTSAMLRLIWKERRISRAEIARLSGLSRSTVSSIVEELMAKGLIDEVGTGHSSGGRRPIMLEFRPRAYILVGIDVGTSHVGLALTDLEGQVELWRHAEHDVCNDPLGTIKLIKDLLDQGVKELELDHHNLVGMGLSVPSPVIGDRGGQLSSEILPAWENVDLEAALAEHYALPIYVDNDANVGALAELWWGAGRGGQDLAFIKVGTGVGCGLIINGIIYRGVAGLAGEIGHMLVSPIPMADMKDTRSSLNDLVGSKFLVERAKKSCSNYPDSELQGLGDALTLRHITDGAKHGDAFAVSLISEAGRYLGVAVSNLLNLLNPGVVVLGGAITNSGPTLVDVMQETIKEQTLWKEIRKTPVLTSELGEYAMAVGAATQILELALSDHELFREPRPAALTAR